MFYESSLIKNFHNSVSIFAESSGWFCNRLSQGASKPELGRQVPQKISQMAGDNDE